MAKKAGLKTNLIFNVSYQLLVIILPLITAPYITRVLGAANTGIFSKTHALANYFYLFSMLGVKNYGNRTIARLRDNRKEMSKAFWEIFSFQSFTSVICILIYICFCVFFAKENQLIYIMQGCYVLSGLFDISWCCFGMEKFKLTTIRSAVIRIISVICVFVFVKNKSDLWIYSLIIASSYLFSGLAIWPFVLRHVDKVKPTFKGIIRHIKPNLVLFWPVVAVSMYNIMDRIILGWMSSDEEVGYYSYAESIVTIPTTLILALDNVIMPRMSNLFAKEDKSSKIQFLMDSVMMFAMFISSAMSLGLAGVSDVFAPWYFGQDFVRCGYFILLLSPVIVFKGWAGALRTQFIIPTGRDKIYIISLTTGAILNLILDLALIPFLNGVGAILGTLAAELSVVLIQFIMCRKDVQIKSYLKNGFSFVIIGVVMFICVELIGLIGLSALPTLIIQICVGAVVYIVLSVAYMLITKQTVLINEGLKMLRIKHRF